MKTKAYLTSMIAVACLLGATAFQAVAQAPAGGRQGGRPGGFLTDDQRAAMRQAMQGSQSEFRELNQKLAEAQKEALKAALAKDADEKTVRAKVEAVAKIQTDIAMLRLKVLKEIAPTLTEEQRTQMEERPGMGYNMLLGGFGGMGRGARGGAGGGRGGGGQQ